MWVDVRNYLRPNEDSGSVWIIALQPSGETSLDLLNYI
jgi:hypothetical protein